MAEEVRVKEGEAEAVAGEPRMGVAEGKQVQHPHVQFWQHAFEFSLYSTALQMNMNLSAWFHASGVSSLGTVSMIAACKLRTLSALICSLHLHPACSERDDAWVWGWQAPLH